MTYVAKIRYLLSCGMAGGVALWLVLSVIPSHAQTPAPKKAPKAAPAPARPPMTRAQLQKLWDDGDETLFMNELRLRGLAFEPDEEWVAALKNPSEQPKAIAELRRRIPPAPDATALAAELPDLLNKIKDAAQKRDEAALAPLVHPDLLANKAKIYDLFDIANYRSHSTGRITPASDRRVGVQLFQLTTSQVERLHYLMFSTYGGKTVLTDVVTGPAVATIFLHDEQQIALSKLDLMFRALNDGDDTGLKNLCTPGLYDSLKRLVDENQRGSTLVRGKYVSLSAISAVPSVSLDQKSVRVVVRVGYPDVGGKKLEYDIDFERVGNDIKVVRVRDLQGGVIAFDPNIDNYLNRRYNLPDGPLVENPPESDDSRFFPLSRFRTFALRALETRNVAKLKEYAAEFRAREPNGGEGYGIQAAADEAAGNFDEAAKDATLAIDRGGKAYFLVLRHTPQLMNGQSSQFVPYILGVTKGAIEFTPVSGQGGAKSEKVEIPAASLGQVQFEKSSGLGGIGGKPRPFLKLEFRDAKSETWNLAAFGTTCPGDPNAAAAKIPLVAYSGGTVCAAQATAAAPATKSKGFGGISIPTIPKGVPGMGNGAAAPLMQVPAAWQQDLKVVLDAVEQARRGGTAPAAK